MEETRKKPQKPPSSVMEVIGETIRQLRLKRNMRQDDVASLAGISPGHMGRIERGMSGLTVSNLIKIANVLCVDAGDLIPNTKEVRKLWRKHKK